MCELIDAGSIRDLVENSVNTSTLVITWLPPSAPNGNILNYRITILDLRNKTWRNESVQNGFIVTNLGMKNNYRVQLIN